MTTYECVYKCVSVCPCSDTLIANKHCHHTNGVVCFPHFWFASLLGNRWGLENGRTSAFRKPASTNGVLICASKVKWTLKDNNTSIASATTTSLLQPTPQGIHSSTFKANQMQDSSKVLLKQQMREVNLLLKSCQIHQNYNRISKKAKSVIWQKSLLQLFSLKDLQNLKM